MNTQTGFYVVTKISRTRYETKREAQKEYAGFSNRLAALGMFDKELHIEEVSL